MCDLSGALTSSATGEPAVVIRANLHNLLFVLGFVALGALLARLLKRTRAARWPVIGQVLQLAPTAA